MPEPEQRENGHTANILGALAVLIQDRVEGLWQSALDLCVRATRSHRARVR